jgi:hypothetical protein
MGSTRYRGDGRVLRVVYEETAHEVVVVTFYPGKRSRYE